MFKLIYIVLCIAGMIGFFFLMRWLVNSASSDFAIGLGVGSIGTAFLMWLAERVQAR